MGNFCLTAKHITTHEDSATILVGSRSIDCYYKSLLFYEKRGDHSRDELKQKIEPAKRTTNVYKPNQTLPRTHS